MAVKGFLAIVDDIENGDLPFAAQVNNGSCAQESPFAKFGLLPDSGSSGPMQRAAGQSPL